MGISDFEIDKYFDGDLTDEQKAAFEERMQTDALFAREVREHERVRKDLFIQGERISLLDQMEEIHHKEYGGIPYLKEQKPSKAEKQAEKIAKKEEESPEPVVKPIVVDKTPPATKPTEVQERKVVSLRMFYMGIGIAAALAAIFTLGGVFLNQNKGEMTADNSGYEPMMMEEGAEDSTNGNSGASDGAHVSPSLSPTKRYSATAFAVAKDGYFITNNHVVKGNKGLKLKVIHEDNTWDTYNAEVVLNDEFSDLAMVKINDTNFKELGILPFTFSEKSAGIGEEVFSIGYPKKDIVMEPGIISSTSGLEGDTTAYQVAMSLNHGNSGGPIFNHLGEVVAVVKGKHNGKEGTGYAVRSDYLWDLIKKYESENDVVIKKPKWNQLRNKRTPAKMIKHIRQFVFMVEAEK